LASRSSSSVARGAHPELAILIGLPGAGKTSFYRARLADTHVHVSLDVLRDRRERGSRTAGPAKRQETLVDEALAAGRAVAVDNVNATAADRARLVAIARRRGVPVVGYLLDTVAGECLRRNAGRVGRERVPDVAVFAARKRFVAPALAEGFASVHAVRAEGGGFRIVDAGLPELVFLLSPASTSGQRARVLLNERAAFPLARALRSADGAELGEVFAFLSALYFRGKLTYARAFGRPPGSLCPAFVITPSEGLRDPAERLTLARLRGFVDVPIRTDEPRYMRPLARDAEALATLAGDACRFVLLGSVATPRYAEPLLRVFGDHLLFPPDFVGRGDMSRGGLLLRRAREGRELAYAPLAGALRHGPRPPRLPRERRTT
jgi:predicted kinase